MLVSDFSSRSQSRPAFALLKTRSSVITSLPLTLTSPSVVPLKIKDGLENTGVLLCQLFSSSMKVFLPSQKETNFTRPVLLYQSLILTNPVKTSLSFRFQNKLPDSPPQQNRKCQNWNIKCTNEEQYRFFLVKNYGKRSQRKITWKH